MSGFLEQLEAQLRAAARAQVTAGRSERRSERAWTRTAIGRIPVLLGVATSIAVAVIALVLIGHKHASAPPQPGATPPGASGPPAPLHLNPAQRKEIVYLEKAQGTVLRQDQGCAPDVASFGDPGHKPSLSQGSPSPQTLATLGVLRRPASPADRLPARIIGAPPHQHTYPQGAFPPATGIYIHSIRYARHRDGANYYLVAAQNANFLRPVPARCYREHQAAVHRELPRIPPQLRAGTLALEPRFLAYQRRTGLPYPGVCLAAVNNTGNGDGGSCYSLGQIKNGRTLRSGAPAGVPEVYGPVPDGVRSVALYYKHHPPEHPLTASVINNVFILHNPGQRLPNNGLPTRIVWRDSNNREIKTIQLG